MTQISCNGSPIMLPTKPVIGDYLSAVHQNNECGVQDFGKGAAECQRICKKFLCFVDISEPPSGSPGLTEADMYPVG